MEASTSCRFRPESANRLGCLSMEATWIAVTSGLPSLCFEGFFGRSDSLVRQTSSNTVFIRNWASMIAGTVGHLLQAICLLALARLSPPILTAIKGKSYANTDK